MFDFTRFSVSDLSLFGIIFFSETEAQKYVDEIKDEFCSSVIISAKTGMPREKLVSFLPIKDRDEQFKWLKENYSSYDGIASRVTVQLGWKILRQRDSLAGAVIDHDIDKKDTPLTDVLFLSRETCEFLYLYGLDTVGDVIAAGDLSYLQRTYPRKVGDFQRVVLQFIIPAFSAAYTMPKDSRDKDLMTVFEEVRSDPPEEILSALQRFITTQLDSFRDGLLSEEKLFCSIYPFDVAPLILCLKHSCCPEPSVKDIELLKKAYETYLKTGCVKAEPWMSDFLSEDDDVAESMVWFFRVAQALLIPMERYLPLEGIDGYHDLQDRPKVAHIIKYGYEYFAFHETCEDLERLFLAADPIGINFLLHFADGTTAVFVDETADSETCVYKGTGKIEGYMTDVGRIAICLSNHRFLFCFDFKRCDTPYYLQKEDHPIPHLRWDRYNNAQKEKKRIVTEAYRALVYQTAKESSSGDPD